jgi:hypothetical protein
MSSRPGVQFALMGLMLALVLTLAPALVTPSAGHFALSATSSTSMSSQKKKIKIFKYVIVTPASSHLRIQD